jgi:hypothetical protein
MHKSALIFGLLASSIVMLVVMPFLNQNNGFSNTAIAQGYDADYYDDNYSKYPTKDKKVACQTGQFEGFFVESVEFCKLTIAQGPPGQNATQVTVNNIRDLLTNQTLQCVLNTSVNPASIDCALPPKSTTPTTLSVSLTIKCTPDDTIPRSAQACNRITTEILPTIYNIDITGNHPNPNRFNGSPVPIIVTLGPDVFLMFVTVSTQVINTIIDNIQSDLNVNIFGPTEHFIGHCPSGEIFAGESLTCNIEERLTVASN